MDYDLEEDKLGIPTVPGTVTLKKDANNLIGISIGGGAQYCPCLYIVQVFDNTPAALDGTLAAGDEITGVNGKTVKGKTKVEVAKMIQTVQGEAAMGEPLYRVSTGNYEYRLVLRCRQEARARFAKMRKDVLEKIELLDQKHVQDIVFQLQRFVSGMSHYYDDCYAILKEADVFPIEVDLSRTAFNYSSQSLSYTDEEEEEGGGGRGEEGGSNQVENGTAKLIDDE
uniref:PRKCA-binding protein n=1 Tax=Nothobranchius furzeri TaxID=105023 RepID=A0A1A8ULZ6_NOTFU